MASASAFGPNTRAWLQTALPPAHLGTKSRCALLDAAHTLLRARYSSPRNTESSREWNPSACLDNLALIDAAANAVAPLCAITAWRKMSPGISTIGCVSLSLMGRRQCPGPCAPRPTYRGGVAFLGGPQIRGGYRVLKEGLRQARRTRGGVMLRALHVGPWFYCLLLVGLVLHFAP